MTKQSDVLEARFFLVELLLESNVFMLRDEGMESDFVGGQIDVDLNRLDLDSLAAMEICIGIEASYGIPIVPEQLNKIRKHSKLAKLIERGRP